MRTLILTVLFGISLQGYSQGILDKKISLDVTDVKLHEVLEIISRKATIEFSYSDDIVPTELNVTLTANDESLKQILSKLLMNLNVEYKVGNNRIILKKSSIPLTQVIRGTIIDRYTYGTIPGANILIQKTDEQMGTVSDVSGRFKFDNVPVGRLTVVVSCIGYDPVILPNISLGTGKEVVLEIKLMESVTAMDEVTIMANRFDHGTSSDAIVSARRFSIEETSRFAGSLSDPARMVSGYAGVTGVGDESNALSVRGNSPRSVLWRIEGMEVPNPNHFASEGSSGGVISMLSPNMIDNSEFLTGAFPAQYGNVLSAVFDVNLRVGNNETHEHSLTAGLLGLEASTEGPFNKRKSSSYLVNYRHSSLSVLDQLGFELSEAGRYKNYKDLAFKLNFPRIINGNLAVYGIGGVSRSDFNQSLEKEGKLSDVGITGISYDRQLSSTTAIKFNTSFSGTHIARDHNINNLEQGPLSLTEDYSKSYIRTNVILDKKFANTYVLSGGVVYSNLSYDFYLQNLDPSNSAYQEIINFQEKGKTSIVQGFVLARQSLTSSLQAVYGFHLLHFSLTKDQSVEPRAGVCWEISSDKKLSLAYGKHSRIENLQYYLARDHQQGGNEFQVNKTLGFTRAHHAVISYRQKVDNTISFKGEVYYQELYNAPVQSDPGSLYASFNEDSGFITDTLVNNGTGKNYGIELSLEKPFSSHYYYLANVTLFQSVFSIGDSPIRNTSYNGNFAIHLLAGKDFALRGGKDRISLNFKLTSAGGRRYIPIDISQSIDNGYTVYDWTKAFQHTLPNYFRMDLQMRYRKNKPKYAVEWCLDIQNVTHRRNAAFYYFDFNEQQLLLKKQTGFLPFLSYRIEF